MHLKIVFTLLLICGFYSAFSQQTQSVIIYDGKGNIIGGSHIKSRPPHQVTLRDAVTNTKFVLDTSHVYITAYNSAGGVLWKTDPWKDNHIDVYRTNRPIIVSFEFGDNPGYPDMAKKGEKVILVEYINTQFGYIDLKTGVFHFMGQD